jgi:hypothetical protein
MKLKIKLIVAVALAGIVGYTSCQKSTVKTTPPPVNYNSIASQIALSLNNSLTGQYGGANINDGVKAPASITPSKSGYLPYHSAGIKLIPLTAAIPLQAIPLNG